jgi:hypothetical protein
VSCKAIYKPAFERITTVKTTHVNKKIKHNANNKGVSKRKLPPHSVANQLKILTPVGTAINIVAAVKYAIV